MKRVGATAPAILAILGACGQQHAPLPVYSTIPEFSLTAQTGKPFQSSTELKGRVWIANFIFTTCSGPCPRMTSQMSQVQKGLAGLEGVKLVSFTVDPARDTPEALAAYAARFGAQRDRWFFLTGAPETLDHLSRKAFLLGSVDGRLDHSTRFVLVDQQGRVRKYYDTTEAGAVRDAVADAARLARAAS